MTNYTHIHYRNIVNTIKTSGHSSLEKYTSHFIWKGCVREGSWRLNRMATYWPPPTLLTITAFHSRSSGLLNWGPGVPASAGTWFSFQYLLSNWSDFLSHPGYIIIWHPPASCECHNSHSIQPIDSQGYPLISLTGCTCYLHRCISYFDSSAGGQYVTLVQGITLSQASLHFSTFTCLVQGHRKVSCYLNFSSLSQWHKVRGQSYV